MTQGVERFDAEAFGVEASRVMREAETILGAISTVEIVADALKRAYNEGRDSERVSGEVRLADAVAMERSECLKLCVSSRTKLIAASRIKARGR